MTGICLFILGMLSAETIDLSMPNAWQQDKMLGWSAGTIKTQGRVGMTTAKKFPVDPSKKYTFSYMVKASKPMNWMLGGFQAYDAKGRLITSPNVNAVAGTMTTVAKTAPRGGRTVYFKDCSGWTAHIGSSIAAGAKADFSDLPNFNIAGIFNAVEKEGELWKVTLTKPLAQVLEAGTSVRLHRPSGALYTCGITYVGDKWVRMKGTISGVSKKPGYSYHTWPAGTAYGEALILVNWKNVRDMTTELEELKLEIE